jgi:hypothetical protein
MGDHFTPDHPPFDLIHLALCMTDKAFYFHGFYGNGAIRIKHRGG